MLFDSLSFKSKTKSDVNEKEFIENFRYFVSQINKSLLFYATSSKRVKVSFGGRGAAKSWSIAMCIILRCILKKTKVLCLRVYQTSLDDSVYASLKRLISFYKLDSFFIITNNKIRGINGSEIIFKGFQNLTSLKSLDSINIAWVEEAVGIGKRKALETMTEDDWNTLSPSIRGENSEIWVSFNPVFDNDFAYTEFASKIEEGKKEYVDDFYHIRRINFDENPHFASSTLATEELHDRGKLKYNHVWLGECIESSKGFPFRSMQVENFDYASWGTPQSVFLDPQFGGSDYHGLSMVWYRDEQYYIMSKGFKGLAESYLKTIDAYVKEFNIKEIVVESNNRGVEVARAIQYKMPNLIVNIFNSRGDKYDRIVNTLAPLIYELHLHSSSDRIIDIKNYNKQSSHDDQIDSIASAIILINDLNEYKRMMAETAEHIQRGSL